MYYYILIITLLMIQDLATVDSILLRELPPLDDNDSVRTPHNYLIIYNNKRFLILYITYVQ